MIEEIFLNFLGSFFGWIIGIFPGFHINNFLPYLVSFSLNPEFLSILIISVAISQTIFSFLPAILLGAPNEENAFSILAGHKLLKEGKGLIAIKYALLGNLFGLLFSLILILILFNLFLPLKNILNKFIHYILVFFLSWMILSERTKKRMVYSLIIISLSGALGYLTLNLYSIPKNYSVFFLLIGFFSLSNLVLSIIQRTNLPKQTLKDFKLDYKNILKCSFFGSLAGIIVGIVPAVSISEVVSFFYYSNFSSLNFLTSLGSVSISNDIFSILSLYLIGNPRSGSSVALQQILPEIKFYQFILFISSIIISASISLIACFKISKYFLIFIEKVGYRKMNLFALILISSSILFLLNFIGILISIISMLIGILCIRLGIKRSNCMASLIIPSIIFFSKLNYF